MIYYVYLILSKKLNKYRSYVGYTKNIEKRLFLHNNSKGAKFTKGRTWHVIYLKKYLSKSIAMKEEYKLKKNYKLRNKIKNKHKQK
tara:strand:- start:125 stop:382 length:258 start_codon:yes stop_codon:yes gene_type:complete